MMKIYALHGLLLDSRDIYSLHGLLKPNIFMSSDLPITISTISGLGQPVAGQVLDMDADDTEEYSVSVSWNNTTSPVASYTDYIATITITPHEGYTLSGVPANFFTVAGAVATNAAGSGVVTAVFPQTGAPTVSIRAIPGLSQPITGQPLDTTVSPTSEYTATVSWNNNTSPVLPSTNYIATITVTPLGGYSLSGVPANFFTVAGASASNAANSGVVTAVFPQTAAPYITIFAPSTQSYTAQTGRTLNVYCNYTWSSVSNSSWLIITSGSGVGNGTIVYSLEANPNSSTRSATITTTSGTTVNYTTVTQAAAPESIVLNPTSVSAPHEGGTVSVNVTSNTTWHIESGLQTIYPWITSITPTPPTGVTGNGTIYVTVALSSQTSERTANIYVRNASSIIPPTTPFAIVQEPTDAILSISETFLSFGAGAASGSVTLISNKPWSIMDPIPSWVYNTSPTSGSGDIVWSFNITAATSTRSTTIRFQTSIGWIRSFSIYQQV